jgi:hypothetical protein
MDDIIFIDLMQSSAFVSVVLHLSVRNQLCITSQRAWFRVISFAANIVSQLPSHSGRRAVFMPACNNDGEKARAHVNRDGNWLPDPHVGTEAIVDTKRSH